MATGNRRRLTLLEYGAPVDLVDQVARAAGIEPSKAKQLIQGAGERAARTLGFSNNPLEMNALGVRAVDLAGMIRLAPALELEIAPKFLGLEHDDPHWREDFFFLANLSRHGRLLAAERLRASGGAPRDLATLVARALTGMYWDNRRRPLRSYRRAHEEDFFVDGEVDPFDLRIPSPEGFPQEVVRYDRRNIFNASIYAAAQALLTEVSDPESVAGLVKLLEDLPGQGRPDPRRARKLPGRSRAWQPIVDLANDVIQGLGLCYAEGFATAPGYVVKTWQTWETLLVIALRLAYGKHATAAQKPYPLGTRTRLSNRPPVAFNVYPDLVITDDAGCPQCIVDAKYKTHAEKGRVRITEADAYEAIAFARATSCNRIVLAYPNLPGRHPDPLGHAETFERIDVGDIKIFGMQIEVRGIAARSGLTTFAQGIKSSLTGLLDPKEMLDEPNT